MITFEDDNYVYQQFLRKWDKFGANRSRSNKVGYRPPTPCTRERTPSPEIQQLIHKYSQVKDARSESSQGPVKRESGYSLDNISKFERSTSCKECSFITGVCNFCACVRSSTYESSSFSSKTDSLSAEQRFNIWTPKYGPRLNVDRCTQGDTSIPRERSTSRERLERLREKYYSQNRIARVKVDSVSRSGSKTDSSTYENRYINLGTYRVKSINDKFLSAGTESFKEFVICTEPKSTEITKLPNNTPFTQVTEQCPEEQTSTISKCELSQIPNNNKPQDNRIGRKRSPRKVFIDRIKLRAARLAAPVNEILDSKEKSFRDIMDFSNFRSTGELSDTTVMVDGKEFKLHKFPLYIKSDFFRALARNPPKDVIELTDFPGGADTFEMVANFCYNVKIAITKENVCGLRCAAEFLQMNTRGNLAELADRFLQDTLTSAKLGRHLGVIIDLVGECARLGPIAEQAAVVDKCMTAIVDCWLLTTQFTKRLPRDSRVVAQLTDSEICERLSEFPLPWFVQLFTKARDKNVRPQVLAKMVQTYINTAVKYATGQDLLEESLKEIMQAKEDRKEAAPGVPDEEDSKTEEEEREKEEVSELDTEQKSDDDDDKAAEEDDGNDGDGAGESTDSQEPEIKEENGSPVDPVEQPAAANNVEATRDQPEDEAAEEEEEHEEDSEPAREVDVKEVLDQLVPEIPDNPVIADLLQPVWMLKVLKLGEELSCDSCPELRRLVGRMLHRFSPRQLSDMPPTVLTEIVQEACKDSQPGQHGLVCGVIDNYLRELSQKGIRGNAAYELNVETFTTMVSAVPPDYRMSHDTLFQVLESLLQSDQVKLTDEQKSALLDTVDFKRLSESTLQRAYDSDLVPQAYITKAALALCGRLRAELDSARAVIKSQEEELARYGLGGRPPPYTAGPTAHYSRHTPHAAPAPAAKLRYEAAPGITYTYPSGAMSSLSSDLELQLALDSIHSHTTDRTELSSDTYYGSSYNTYNSSYSSYYDDPLDSQDYRSKSYYRSFDPRYNYKY